MPCPSNASYLTASWSQRPGITREGKCRSVARLGPPHADSVLAASLSSSPLCVLSFFPLGQGSDEWVERCVLFPFLVYSSSAKYTFLVVYCFAYWTRPEPGTTYGRLSGSSATDRKSRLEEDATVLLFMGRAPIEGRSVPRSRAPAGPSSAFQTLGLGSYAPPRLVLQDGQHESVLVCYFPVVCEHGCASLEGKRRTGGNILDAWEARPSRCCLPWRRCRG